MVLQLNLESAGQRIGKSFKVPTDRLCRQWAADLTQFWAWNEPLNGTSGETTSPHGTGRLGHTLGMRIGKL